MGPPLPVFYNCQNCPSYCCTYHRIEVEPSDLERLAKHLGVTPQTVRRRYTKKGWLPGERVMKHQDDDLYGTACTFLDLDTRLCTVHDSRPEVCRDHPGARNCSYYTFLMSERKDQEDPDLVSRAYNIRGEWPEMDKGDD